MSDILQNLNLHPCPNAPCIFKGEIIKGKAPLYLGLYVDDFIYFSIDPTVEKQFQTILQKQTNVDFLGQVNHFLSIRFQWRHTHKRTRVHLSQEAFADTLIAAAQFSSSSTTHNKTPYRSGYPVDKIPPDHTLIPAQQAAIESKYRTLVGSLLWLSQGTRPDLSTITNILAQHQHRPNDKHIAAARYVIKYVLSTKSKGITFDSQTDDKLTSYVHFPISTSKVTATSDANWGPQDQTQLPQHELPPELELFKTRSMSGHLVTLLGPLHWSSKRQRITARSSCEAEIYATDECVKNILHLRNIIQDLDLETALLNPKTQIFNDNMACVMWSKNTTTKGLRYLQIRENAIRENSKILTIEHIAGKVNPADIFTKEDKDSAHFIDIRDTIVTDPLPKSLFVSFPCLSACDVSHPDSSSYERGVSYVAPSIADIIIT